MLNRYAWWKNFTIALLLALGLLYALPNLFGKDPAVQVSADRGAAVDQTTLQRLEQALDDAGIAAKRIELTPDRLLARFATSDDQLKAAGVIAGALGRGFTVALNLAPTTPGWLEAVNGRPMNLGLDLRGGVYFLMEVDMDAAITKADETYANEIRTLLRRERIRYLAVGPDDSGGVVVRFREGTDAEVAADLIETENPDLQVTVSELGDQVSARLTPAAVEEIQRFRRVVVF